MSVQYLESIRKRSEDRKSSDAIGGVREWGEIDFLLRYIDGKVCVCTDMCPEDPESNDCAHCRHLDPYDPCPVVGFGCGSDCDDDEHCTPEQQKAADL